MKQIVWLASLSAGLVFPSPPARAALHVLTTTTDLRSIVQEVGAETLTAESIAKGTQDPHFVEAKPSFMLKANRADLVIAIGLELEVGWLPSIVRGARNPKINPGAPGYLEVGPLVEPLEIATGKISRAEGDVHPLGNPHVTLDPMRAGTIAIRVAERLGQLDPANAPAYMERARAFQSRMQQKTRAWQARITRSGVTQVVTYHKTLTYFLARFGIANPAILEPKPGVPPTSGHILEVIGQIRSQKIPLILVENYFDPTVTRKIMQEVPAVRSHTIPVAIEGEPAIGSLDALYENLVATIEGSHK